MKRRGTVTIKLTLQRSVFDHIEKVRRVWSEGDRPAFPDLPDWTFEDVALSLIDHQLSLIDHQLSLIDHQLETNPERLFDDE